MLVEVLEPSWPGKQRANDEDRWCLCHPETREVICWIPYGTSSALCQGWQAPLAALVWELLRVSETSQTGSRDVQIELALPGV